MEISRSDRFKKAYKKLLKNIQQRFEKQLSFLVKDFHYPSLRVKKKRGGENVWEARITKSYRFTFRIIKKTLQLLLIGTHDEGLGKK